MSIESHEEPEGAALGAALMAGVSTGFIDLADVESITETKHHIEPEQPAAARLHFENWVENTTAWRDPGSGS